MSFGGKSYKKNFLQHIS